MLGYNFFVPIGLALEKKERKMGEIFKKCPSQVLKKKKRLDFVITVTLSLKLALAFSFNCKRPSFINTEVSTN